MGRIITAPGVLANVQGQIDHMSDIYQEIKDNNLKPLTITIDPVTNANGAYTHTTEDDRITEDMKALTLELGTPEVFSAPITITSGEGTVTLVCDNAHGTSTVTVTFIHTWPVDGGEDVPASVTSTEFDILADRIGVLSNLETEDKTSIVNAINDLQDDVNATITSASQTLSQSITSNTQAIANINNHFIKNISDINSSNINNYTESGIYYAWMDSDLGVGAWGTLIVSVNKYGSTILCIDQTIISNGATKIRHYEQGTWSNWTELAKKSDVYVVSGTMEISATGTVGTGTTINASTYYFINGYVNENSLDRVVSRIDNGYFYFSVYNENNVRYTSTTKNLTLIFYKK